MKMDWLKMTCKDCLHYEACNEVEEFIAEQCMNITLVPDDEEIAKNCNVFKDKNRYVEVKQGEWIKNDLEIAVEYTCSICGYMYCEADPKEPPEKYCCKCGAKNEF